MNKVPYAWVSIQKKIEKVFVRLDYKAQNRTGGGYTTGLCSVRSDMQSGIAHARFIYQEFRFEPSFSIGHNRQRLIRAIRKAAAEYPFHDSEGYAAGTMVDAANEIKDIKVFIPYFSSLYRRITNNLVTDSGESLLFDHQFLYQTNKAMLAMLIAFLCYAFYIAE